MAELWLVRHGQASFGADNYDQLSALGVQQAVWLGEYFAERGIEFDRVLTGTQVRHHQTARGIAQGMGLRFEPEQHAGLNEYDFYGLFGALGDEHAEIKSRLRGDKRAFYSALKQVLKLWMDNALEGPLPETWDDFYSRVGEGIRFATATTAKRVLVVSSGGPIGTVAGMAMMSPPVVGIELNLQIRNTSISQYYFNSEALRLATFNGIPHLDRPDRLEAVTYG